MVAQGPPGAQDHERDIGGEKRARTVIYLVSSPQPRVGKTLVARLFLDFLIGTSRNPILFDTNCFEPTLASLFPERSVVVDLASVRGQMDLFDPLVEADGRPKVVDLWHGAYGRFFKQAEEFGFLKEAAARGIQPVIALLTDERDQFADELEKRRSMWHDAKIVLVDDVGAVRTVGARPPYPLYHAIEIPELDPMVRRAIEETGWVSYRMVSRPRADDATELELRSRALLEPVFWDIERLDLKLALEQSPSIP